jgi:tight adherence protein C
VSAPLTTVVLAGSLVGLGAFVAWAGVAPRPPSLRAALDRIGRPHEPRWRGSQTDVDARLGRAARGIGVVDRAVERMRTDLVVLHRSADEQAAALVAHVLLGCLWAPAVSLGGWLVGVSLPLAIPLWGAPLGGALAGWWTIQSVRSTADRRRITFSRAISSVCDLAAMGLASGRGLESSLTMAVAASPTWPYRDIKGALEAGYLRGEAPWVALTRLGEEAGLGDLVELAAALQLAGDEGAAVRQTIARKAASTRERLTADAEQRAAATTERMGIPATFLLLGFVVFLGYPAIAVLFR